MIGSFVRGPVVRSDKIEQLQRMAARRAATAEFCRVSERQQRAVVDGYPAAQHMIAAIDLMAAKSPDRPMLRLEGMIALHGTPDPRSGSQDAVLPKRSDANPRHQCCTAAKVCFFLEVLLANRSRTRRFPV